MERQIPMTKNQILANRRAVKKMWEGIPDERIDLGVYLRGWGQDGRGIIGEERILDDFNNRHLFKCDGVLDLTEENTCGTYGCFAGWSWMHPTYQAWCKANRLQRASISNLAYWLGLTNDSACGLFSSKNSGEEVTEKEEVEERLERVLAAPVVLPQEAKPGAYSSLVSEDNDFICVQ